MRLHFDKASVEQVMTDTSDMYHAVDKELESKADKRSTLISNVTVRVRPSAMQLQGLDRPLRGRRRFRSATLQAQWRKLIWQTVVSRDWQ